MRVRAIVTRIMLQFIRDKRTLGLMLVAPMFVLLLMNLVFNGEEYQPAIAVSGIPEQWQEALRQNGAKVYEYTKQEAAASLDNQEIDAILEMDGMTPALTLEGSDPTVNQAVLLTVQQTIQDLLPVQQGTKPSIKYLHGSQNMALFDNFGPVLIGFFIFFFVFLIAGVSFLRERVSGTLERLLATPVRRWEIVTGYVVGFGIFTTVQASLISWFAVKVLGIMMEGSFLYVLLITFLLAMTALTLGILLSSFAENELQMIQFIPLVVVPQVFFSGLFNLDTMSDWLRSISYVMPLYYGADALREIMIRGNSWAKLAVDVYVLVGFSASFMTLNVLALKKHRKL